MNLSAASLAVALVASAVVAACDMGDDPGAWRAPRRDAGAGSGADDPSPGDDAGDPGDPGDPGDAFNAYDTPPPPPGCTPHDHGCGATEVCGNGLDDNCDGHVDESCPCLPGTVQECFVGPPGLRNVGACHGGTQRCTGGGEFGSWGECAGGIGPAAEVCDGLDNDCNGCVDEGLMCHPAVTCPGPGDSRVPDGAPFADYPLRGELFYAGAATSWSWRVAGGPCDRLLPRPTFTLADGNARDARFHPTLSGDYTVTLTIVTATGETITCTFIVHIAGPGLRVELCWDTSTTVDLDLYLHTPNSTGAWFNPSGPDDGINNNSCNWANCEARLRSSIPRESWGLANSPLSACQNGPHGADWASLGYCTNPRLDIDNNLMKSSGTPENINVDNPHDAWQTRVMVHNYTGTAAHPMINVYCGGRLRATLGAAPDVVPSFTGISGDDGIGALWRAADVTVHVNASGVTTGCDVTPLHPPGASSGYYVTNGVLTY